MVDPADELALVEYVARQMVDLLGADAVPRLYEQAEVAERIADTFSARTWLDIAGRAKDLIR